MRSFVEQQGVPLLLFRRSGKMFSIGQVRYAPFGARVPDTRWQIPVCVRRGSNRLCRLLAGRTDSFTLDGPGPIVPNAGGAGYYRFEMPEREWNALIANAGSLSGGEALAVVDSLSASLLAGRGNVGELARLARKLIRHPDSYAADAAADAMGELVADGIVDAQGRAGWNRFRAGLYGPLLRKYGFDPRAGAYVNEAPERSQRRAQIVQRLLPTHRAVKLRRRLSAATQAFLAGDRTALDPAWFGPALDLYVEAGGLQAAKTLVGRALATEDPEFRPAAIDAAAGSGDEKVARWLFEDLVDSRLRPNERSMVLSAVMSRASTRDFGLRWLMAHLDELMSGRNGIFFSASLPGLFSHFCSVAKAEQLKSELTARFADTSAELEFNRTLERIHNCGVLEDGLGAEISADFAKLR